MSTTIHAYAAMQAGNVLVPYTYEVGPLVEDEVQIKVEYCGVCHSDISMSQNDWHMSSYPLVPGHEVIGLVHSVGPAVKHLKVGTRVGLGWHSGYCGGCAQCNTGDHNLCTACQPTIVSHHGGMADYTRAREIALIPIPEACNPATVGPLLCGGITVYTPLVEYGIQAGDHIGVVGIGGLGHLAVKFLRTMGCEITAFSSNPKKEKMIKDLGVHHIVSSTSSEAITALAGTFKMILVTVNVDLDWNAYITALAPRGRLHIVGVMPVMKIQPVGLLFGMKEISGSPVGNPENIRKMLALCALHKIEPIVEEFSLAECNTAFVKIESNTIHFRAVLKM